MSKLQLVRNSTRLCKKTADNVHVFPKLKNIQQTLLLAPKKDTESILHYLTEGVGNQRQARARLSE